MTKSIFKKLTPNKRTKGKKFMGQIQKKILKMNITDILTTSNNVALIKTRPSIYALSALAVDKR